MKKPRNLLFLIGMICIVFIMTHLIRGGSYDDKFWIALITFFISFIAYSYKDMIGRKVDNKN